MTTKFDTQISLKTDVPAAQYEGVADQTKKEVSYLHIITKKVSNVVIAGDSSPKNVIEIAPVELSQASSERAMEDTDKTLNFDADEELGPDDYITEEEIDRIITGYEQQYGMSSDEFLKAWENNTAPDTFETNSWARLLDFKRR